MDAATEPSHMAPDTTQLAPASEGACLVDKTSTFGAVQSGLAGIEFTGTGLVISTPTVSVEDYNAMFSMVLSLNKSCHWLLGDALLLGDTQWGNQYTESKYDDAHKATGLSLSTLRNIVYTCKKFPRSARHSDLSFTHHLEAASIKDSPEARETVLSEASAKGMTVKDLRRAVREVKAERMTDEAKEKICPNDDRPFGVLDLPTKEEATAALPIAFELDKAVVWMLKNPVDRLTPEHRTQLQERLAPIVAYAAQLTKAGDIIEC